MLIILIMIIITFLYALRIFISALSLRDTTGLKRIFEGLDELIKRGVEVLRRLDLTKDKDKHKNKKKNKRT